jgi:uncharacterized membrane protein SpoIIM required for sporulation
MKSRWFTCKIQKLLAVVAVIVLIAAIVEGVVTGEPLGFTRYGGLGG